MQLHNIKRFGNCPFSNFGDCANFSRPKSHAKITYTYIKNNRKIIVFHRFRIRISES